jgi:putative membrane protein
MLALPVLYAHEGDDSYDHHSEMVGMGWWLWPSMGMFGGWFGFIFMIIFWALVIWGVVYLIKQLTKKEEKHTPLQILKMRYAKGEITKKQYEEMKKRL